MQAMVLFNSRGSDRRSAEEERHRCSSTIAVTRDHQQRTERENGMNDGMLSAAGAVLTAVMIAGDGGIGCAVKIVVLHPAGGGSRAGAR